VTFECSSDVSDSFLPWFNSLCVTTSSSLHQCTQYRLYNGNLGGFLRQGFSVTEDDNATHVTRDLSIRSTQHTHAGVYLCAELRPDVAGVLDSASAQLIVLGECFTYLRKKAYDMISQFQAAIRTDKLPNTFVYMFFFIQNCKCYDCYQCTV